MTAVLKSIGLYVGVGLLYRPEIRLDQRIKAKFRAELNFGTKSIGIVIILARST